MLRVGMHKEYYEKCAASLLEKKVYQFPGMRIVSISYASQSVYS